MTSKTVSSLVWLVLSFTDINSQPVNLLSYSVIKLLSTSIRSVILANNSCNEGDYTVFDFSRFQWLRSIKIGNNCFESVKTFKIDGLNRLKTIKIGNNSFTQNKNGGGNDASKSFHILNCESLECIQIGDYSFSDFAGNFELKNLPQLQSIQIGTVRSDSYNFSCSSFVIRGIELILNIWMIRSSKSTIHYIRWCCIRMVLINNNREYWMNLNEMIWIDLPSLQSITLGSDALQGIEYDSCSLIMRSNIEMIRNDWM